MASDYPAIREENLTRYGTDIGRIGRMLLADRYDDRTHFIYELLQNAEDALAKREDWQGQRSVRFHLLDCELRFSHFGSPFDEADVRGICGIDESTKDITQIGRFGIGFKSVYAFTERPEIHSDAEDFAIENFVWPVAVPGVDRAAEETIILMPLLTQTPADREEIEAGLQRLGPDVLLFLREIEEIEWEVEDGASGLYLRQCDELDEHVRRVTVIGQAEGKPDVEETWLVFSKPVHTAEEVLVGHVEVAFLLKDGRVTPIPQSPLVVFFPTVVQTGLGFRVQGPYRSTPSRDNVPQRDGWNRYCVNETAATLIDALAWLRDQDMLCIDALQCLPLDREKFHQHAMFYQFFEDTKRAFLAKRLPPFFGGGYVTAGNAKLARTIGGASIGAGPGTDDGPAGERAGRHRRGQHRDRTERPGRGARGDTLGNAGARPFISYVAIHPDDVECDPDDLGQAARMDLETRAIDFILSIEPNWKRTPIANPGFDLFETGPDGRPTRWCEVKAMTGSLGDRPVGVSSKQFECAREHGTSYWLYVVEHAGDENARLVRIQDPAGKARTFTFDHGWLNVAQVHSGQDHQSS